MDGVVSMFTKFQDTKLGQYKVDGQVYQTEVKASTDTLIAFKDDIGLRICRDIICAPIAVWCALYGWDTIWALHNRDIMWHVADFPKEVAYLPGMVLTFLFGNLGLNMWKRR